MEDTLDPDNQRGKDFNPMSGYFILFDRWLEAPQVVLDGTELLVLCGLILVGGFALFKASREGGKDK